ncbi:MAG: RidA family protein [Pseudomonadota bacterium]
MQERIVNPRDGIYRTTPDYVHALEVSGVTRQLYVSGTIGLQADGTAPKDLDDQLRLIWSNIRRILKDADMTTDNIVRVTSYLTDASFTERNQDARLKALGNRRVPATAIVVETLDPSWLVEIEVIAVG